MNITYYLKQTEYIPITDRHTHTHVSIKDEYYKHTLWNKLNMPIINYPKKKKKKTERTHTGICHYIFSRWVYEALCQPMRLWKLPAKHPPPHTTNVQEKRDKEHSPLHTVDVRETMQFCGPALMGVNVLFSSAMKRNHHHETKQPAVPQLSSSKHLLSGTLFQLRYAALICSLP